MILIEFLVWTIVLLFAVLTLLPLSKYPHGLVRTAEFPRIQIATISCLAIPVAFWAVPGPRQWWVVALLAVIAVVQAGYIARFTPFWHRQSLRPKGALAEDSERHVSFVAANVKMSNREYGRLLTVIEETAPDIVMLLEVDDGWIKAMAPLRERYAMAVERPLSNSYGMALYANLPLFETDLREKLVKGIPSIRTGVELRSKDRFRLYVLHPEPPVPNHDTEGRDGEIAQTGLEAAADDLPAVVSGDLNDVAWSATTRRFQRLSRLLDPRVGRGFFNTFDARFPFMRWPLDHLFHDPRFRLIEIKRLPKIGSDHFPILFRLALAEEPRANAPLDDPAQGEREEVDDMIEREKAASREPIGTDWEKE